jgi:hypothetical protein
MADTIKAVLINSTGHTYHDIPDLPKSWEIAPGRLAYPLTETPVPDNLAGKPVDFDGASQTWVSAEAAVANELAAKAQEAAAQAQQAASDAQAQTAAVNKTLDGAKSSIQAIASTIPDKAAPGLAFAWPAWSGAGVKYTKGQIVSYSGQLYRVAQDHTSQADWLPTATAALYSLIAYDSQGYRIWIKPTGAQDAYTKDEVVRYHPDGKLYKSKVAGNVWEPTQDGKDQWTEVAN